MQSAIIDPVEQTKGRFLINEHRRSLHGLRALVGFYLSIKVVISRCCNTCIYQARRLFINFLPLLA